MIIKILGSGCSKCRKLEQNARKAAEESGVDFEIEKVTEMNEITSYGVPVTPVLIIDEEVKAAGNVPSPAKIKGFLKK